MTRPRSLPVVLDLPNPCDVEWDSMQGDDRTRFCGACGRNVVNLSVLSADEAVEAVENGSCVSFECRSDATIVTHTEDRPRSSSAGLVLMVAATLAATLGCTRRGGSDVAALPPPEATVARNEIAPPSAAPEVTPTPTSSPETSESCPLPSASAQASPPTPSSSPPVRLRGKPAPQPQPQPQPPPPPPRLGGAPMRVDVQK
ncbi:MAG: hypothetical protein QM756_36330 [Polyangiaceae bacterium]